MTLGKMSITWLVFMLGTNFWYQLIPLSMGYLPKTVSGGYRMLFQELVTKSVTWGGASAPDGPMLRLQPSITSPMVSEKSSKWNQTSFWVGRGDRHFILLGMRHSPPPSPLKSLPPLPNPWKRWKSRKSMKNISLAPCCCFQSILNS